MTKPDAPQVLVLPGLVSESPENFDPYLNKIAEMGLRVITLAETREFLDGHEALEWPWAHLEPYSRGKMDLYKAEAESHVGLVDGLVVINPTTRKEEATNQSGRVLTITYDGAIDDPTLTIANDFLNGRPHVPATPTPVFALRRPTMSRFRVQEYWETRRYHMNRLIGDNGNRKLRVITDRDGKEDWSVLQRLWPAHKIEE